MDFRIADTFTESLARLTSANALKTMLKADINAEAWATLRAIPPGPFDKPNPGRIPVKVINHLGDEVMKSVQDDLINSNRNMDDACFLPVDALVRSLAVNRGRPICLLLGAGASISSGMPSAQRCIWEWKQDIFVTNNPGLRQAVGELSLPGTRGTNPTLVGSARALSSGGGFG